MRALNAPATAPPCLALLASLQTAGLGAATGAWPAPVVTPVNSSLADVAAAVTAAVSVPRPPSPPPLPPWPPASPAPPGALGGYGGATNRHYELASTPGSTAGAAIGIVLAAIVVLVAASAHDRASCDGRARAAHLRELRGCASV